MQYPHTSDSSDLPAPPTCYVTGDESSQIGRLPRRFRLEVETVLIYEVYADDEKDARQLVAEGGLSEYSVVDVWSGPDVIGIHLVQS